MNDRRAQAVINQLVAAAATLSKQLSSLDWSGAPPWIYNPLEYAWEAHCQYITKYARPSCEVVFLGMNPGPWGMSQTGVPFGEVLQVTSWLKIDARIGRPALEHPKRPVLGLDCPRQEVSGQRFWGFFRQQFDKPELFFKKHFVASYCPLAFMEESGLNVTPDKLPAAIRKPLEACCDLHLQKLLEAIKPSWLIGVGAWAEKCAARVVGQMESADVRIGRILHPSPASPSANRQWSMVVEQQLRSQGVWS